MQVLEPKTSKSLECGARPPGLCQKEVFTIDSNAPISEQAPFLSCHTAYRISSVCSLGLLPFMRKQFASLAATLILPAWMGSTQAVRMEHQQLKNRWKESLEETSQEFDLEIKDQATINGMALFLNKAEKESFTQKAASEQKWVIRFNGNGQFYELSIEESLELANHLQANMLLFNYRGVGESQGRPVKAEDLVMDGEACVQYLLSKGVKEENILIYGLSLGGGVGTQVVKLHEKMGLINDRSFSSLSTVIRALLGSGFLAKLAPALGWELDSEKTFAEIKNKKMIVFHKNDGVIPYHQAALYKLYKQKIKTTNPQAVEKALHKGKMKDRLKAEFKPERVKLQARFTKRQGVLAHCYPIYTDKSFPKVQRFAREFFNKTKG